MNPILWLLLTCGQEQRLTSGLFWWGVCLQVLGVLQEPHNSDLEMMIGGELAVTAVGGFNLHGDPGTTNPFVVLRIKNEEQVSRCEFESVNPMWNYQINFEGIVALNMELVVRALPLWSPAYPNAVTAVPLRVDALRCFLV